MSGLSGMRVEPLEVEFASDEEDHRAHGLETGVAERPAFGRLEQPIESFEEGIGLPSLGPRHDSLEMLMDHSGHIVHGATLERSTCVHHCRSMAEMTWICLRAS